MMRDMAHYISDQSFEKLTGIKGAFSTRLLYVTAERASATNTRYTLQRSDYYGPTCCHKTWWMHAPALPASCPGKNRQGAEFVC